MDGGGLCWRWNCMAESERGDCMYGGIGKGETERGGGTLLL